MLKIEIFPITVFEDNQSCIRMASTLETKRTKHVDVKHHFIRDCVSQGKITLNYISTDLQQADILTKALTKQKFICFRNCLNVVELPCSEL